MPGALEKGVEDLLETVHCCGVVGLGANHDVLVAGKARSCRNEVAADNVLLKALEVVNAGTDGGFREHLRSLLEGGGGDE